MFYSLHFTLPLIALSFFAILYQLRVVNTHRVKVQNHAVPETEHLNDVQVRQNIWTDLDHQEVQELIPWLHSQFSLNLTSTENATYWDNFVDITEILKPNKSDAIAFLDRDTLRTLPPKRYARVTVKRNSQETAAIEEYAVGPLPIGHETQVTPLAFPYNSRRSSTPSYTPNLPELENWFDQIISEVDDIVHYLLSGPILGFEKPQAVLEEFTVASNDQIWVEEGRTMRWITFFRKGLSSTILPQGLYFKADTTGRDPRAWRVVLWLYNGITYDSVKELRAACSSPDFKKLPPNADGSWTIIEPPPMPASFEYSREPPPTFQQLGDSRITIDRKELFVSWMGFSFNFAFSQVNGISLFDIRLDGERIVYELSLQEALSHYAGNDPIQSGTAFLDSLFGYGSDLSELVPGYDCPSYSHFFDTTHFRLEKAHHRYGTVCIFEAPTDYPIQRHARGSFITSFANSVMILRTIATVGNYDYLIDYIFYLDGTIEVKLRASGFIQGAYWNNGTNSRYGYRVHDFLSSSIHDHVLNFKIDLDIAGQKNNISRRSVVSKEVDYPWSATGSRRTMQLERSQIRNENESSLNWPPNSATMYVITGEKNYLGESRGYRIMPGTGAGTPIHLTMAESSNLLKAAEWAKHDFYVTKQKDTEPCSASPMNALTPNDPLIRFDEFLDGDNLVDEDLVVWFNIGNHHVPHTGDIPNTLMSTSASSIMFAPHNYHERDRSRALTSGVLVDFSQQKQPSIMALGSGDVRGDFSGFRGREKPGRNHHL